MNLFPLHTDPVKAAHLNCDQHVNKILLECAQMLANCFTLQDLQHAPKTKAGTCRKFSYYNHPVSQWVRTTRANFSWTVTHAFALEDERLYRGFRPHFSFGFIKWCADNVPNVPTGNLTDFAIAISDNKKCRHHHLFNSLSTTAKYQLYYRLDKSDFATWTNRPIPDFMTDHRFN